MDLTSQHKPKPRVHLISLIYVRMAAQGASYLRNTRAAALTTPYGPWKGRGNELLYGECLISPRQ